MSGTLQLQTTDQAASTLSHGLFKSILNKNTMKVPPTCLLLPQALPMCSSAA